MLTAVLTERGADRTRCRSATIFKPDDATATATRQRHDAQGTTQSVALLQVPCLCQGDAADEAVIRSDVAASPATDDAASELTSSSTSKVLEHAPHWGLITLLRGTEKTCTPQPRIQPVACRAGPEVSCKVAGGGGGGGPRRSTVHEVHEGAPVSLISLAYLKRSCAAARMAW